MAAKSIIDIDVNDDKFQSFMEKFNEYQAALDDLPEAWRGVAQGIGDTEKETAKARSELEGVAKSFSDGAAAILSINSGLDRLNDSLDKANKNQSGFNKNAGAAKKFLSGATKDAKSLASHIKDATTSLISWGSILGLFSGLIGAGGLFGINRLASGAASQRFTTLGLGTTSGGLDSTAINYQRALSNPTGTLGAIRDSQLDLSKRWQFQAMGINNPDQDPAKLLPQMIRNARDIFVKNGSNLQGAEAHGLTNFFTLDDLNRFKNMSDAEIDSMEKQSQKDAVRLQLTDQQLKQWQDFNVQLDLSNRSIRNAFVTGLAPLAPSLGKLSDAVSGAIDTFLQSPELGKWIDGLSQGIQKFGNYLASPQFKSDVDDFMSKVERMGTIIGNVVDWILGKTDSAGITSSITSSSSILNAKPVTDPQTGKTYTPGGEDDPHVWGWLKGVKSFFSGSNAPSKYDDFFLEAAKKEGHDPRLLKAIAGAESSWNVNAVSKAGAQGLMQVMPANFKPGEDPFNPRDNIMAGARVFSDGMRYAEKNGGGIEEALRYYNGGVRRGSKENMQYPSRVGEQYATIYGNKNIGNNDNEQRDSGNSSKTTDKLLQQILEDGQRRTGGGAVVVYNNTGGNAIVNSAQLGGYG
ncbi:lytic transglycosylase domain-containing protein [Yersinia enterocolitica]